MVFGLGPTRRLRGTLPVGGCVRYAHPVPFCRAVHCSPFRGQVIGNSACGFVRFDVLEWLLDCRRFADGDFVEVHDVAIERKNSEHDRNTR